MKDGEKLADERIKAQLRAVLQLSKWKAAGIS